MHAKFGESVSSEESEENRVQSRSQTQSLERLSDEDDEDDLTAFLKEKTMNEGAQSPQTSIDKALQLFTNAGILSAKSDLLKYWEESNVGEQLRTLAKVVHSVAAVNRDYLDSGYLRQVRTNDEIHSAELQGAILFLGGNHRLNLKESAGK